MLSPPYHGADVRAQSNLPPMRGSASIETSPEARSAEPGSWAPRPAFAKVLKAAEELTLGTSAFVLARQTQVLLVPFQDVAYGAACSRRNCRGHQPADHDPSGSTQAPFLARNCSRRPIVSKCSGETSTDTDAEGNLISATRSAPASASAHLGQQLVSSWLGADTGAVRGLSCDEPVSAAGSEDSSAWRRGGPIKKRALAGAAPHGPSPDSSFRRSPRR